MSRCLTAFYTATGSTRRAAVLLADEAGSDLIEILPAVPYTNADLNWSDATSRTFGERSGGILPELASPPCTACDGYDTIFLGFPVWYNDAPAVVRSFLNQCDTRGARVILFGTSNGSGLGSIAQSLQPLCVTSSIETGRILNGPHVTAGYVRKWLRHLRIS